MSALTGQEITTSAGTVKVHTSQPNPYGTEWSAVDDNYDAEYAGPEDGWVSSSPCGWGKTEAEAIADLEPTVRATCDPSAMERLEKALEAHQ